MAPWGSLTDLPGTDSTDDIGGGNIGDIFGPKFRFFFVPKLPKKGAQGPGGPWGALGAALGAIFFPYVSPFPPFWGPPIFPSILL